MPVFTNINLTTSAGVAPGVVQYYERTLLDNLAPEMVHSRDAQKRTLPLHNGKRVQFRKFTPFTAVTSPLAEGTTPDGQSLTQTAFTATVKPYGAYVPLSDEIQWYMLDDIHRETARILADQAALSLDTISRDAICAGYNVQYASNATSRDLIDAGDRLTYAEIKKAVRTLKRKNAKPFPDGFYHAIVHPDAVYDLTSDQAWTDVSKYIDSKGVEKYELGTVYKVKFFESTNAKVTTLDQNAIGTNADLSISTSVLYNATTKTMVLNEKLTEAEARELAGKLVWVADTTGDTTLEPMVIEYATAGDADVASVTFRYNGVGEVNWTNGKQCKLHGAHAGTAGADVYETVIYGQDAFGSIELAGTGKSVEIIVNAPGSAGAEDPLNQRATIAWKAKGFCTIILQDDFIVRVEHGATA